MPSAELPNRSLFKPPEVCEIAQLQPYVLRSWEAEFPDLGIMRAGARVYRRNDVERVLRIKHLLFVEGLTLAGVRRRLEEEREPLPALDDLVEEPAPRGAGARAEAALRRQLSGVRDGLKSILDLLAKDGGGDGGFELRPQAEGDRPAAATSTRAAAPGAGKSKKLKPERSRKAPGRR